MQLPNAKGAIVPQEKITEYLLCATHRDGRHKAAFFTRFGFSVDAWEVLAMALRKHASDHEVAKVENSPFGTRYVVDGTINTPDGKRPVIRSVWFIPTAGDTPCFVTAYPLRRSR